MEQIEIVFDIDKIETVAIERVQPNPWNPKDIDTVEYQGVVSSLRKKGLRQPIVVREVDDYFQIIDGEQRWRGWKELGNHEILIYNEGPGVSDQEAKELTISYQQQVPFVQNEFAKLLQEMTEQYDNLELPIEDEDIQDLIALLDIDLDEKDVNVANHELPTRDVFIDQFDDHEKPNLKDGNWFYIEYYGRDELYNELHELLTPYLVDKREHEITPDVFEKMVRLVVENGEK